MLEYPVKIYPKDSSALQVGEAAFSNLGMRLYINGEKVFFTWSDLSINDRIGQLPIKMTLPDGRLVEITHSTELEALLKQCYQRGDRLTWLESHWGIVLVSLAMFPVILWVIYMWVVPYAAAQLASKIPPEWEQRIGVETLAYLDENVVEVSQLSDDQVERVEQLWRRLSISDQYRLELRASEELGANALALPGGTIVLTDELIELLTLDAELVAVLGHEIGHIDHDHMTNSLLRSAVLALMLNWIVGDVGGVAELTLTTFPTVIGQLAYSRELEAEADQKAVEFLRFHNLSAECIGSALRKLSRRVTVDADISEEQSQSVTDYFRTHPHIEKRIAAVGGESCL